jgi:hypothetical protein
VTLHAGSVAFDKVELGVELGEENAEVAPLQHELLDSVHLLFEISLLRKKKLEAARLAVFPPHVSCLEAGPLRRP